MSTGYEKKRRLPLSVEMERIWTRDRVLRETSENAPYLENPFADSCDLHFLFTNLISQLKWRVLSLFFPS
jgi:hypothetical protein